jgi:flagellar hook-associated protein 2
MTTTSGTNPVSVASSSSAAAAGGSVINVSSLVSQLVAAAQAPQAAVITSQTQGVTSQISALGTLKSALSTFQSSLSTLDTPSAFAVQTASSSNHSVFTTTASSSAVAGNYDVTVTQLAQGQQLVSKPIVGGSSATLGTGALTLSLGGSSFNVTIDSTNNTANGVAAAINSASGNPGITATVINGTDGAHLVLSSALTGAANTIQVSQTGGGTALSSLTYTSGNTANYTQSATGTPQDAKFSIAGISYTNSSNTISNALTGVTLNLTGTTASSGAATLTVSSDTSTIATNIGSFVTAYNTMHSSLTSLGSYDASTGTAGPMLGDALLQGVQNQIRQTLNSMVGSSAYNTLASVGVTTNSDGSLSLSSAKLATALSTNVSAVTQLFSGTTGIATTLNTQLTSELASNGPVNTRGQTLVTQENSLTQQQTDLNTRMAALSASLTQQFSSLNTLLSSLQTTSSYLSQAFASLPTVQGKPSG